MKLYKILFIGIMGLILSLGTMSYAQNSKWANNPLYLLEEFAHDVNSGSKIQETALNDFNTNKGQYATEYKITNTFDALRQEIAPYIQRTMYIGLSLAVLGIIYNGFTLVTQPVTGEDNRSKAKTRITNIMIGIAILTGFYVIIQLILGVVDYILQ